jgi:hypothetical protein
VNGAEFVARLAANGVTLSWRDVIIAREFDAAVASLRAGIGHAEKRELEALAESDELRAQLTSVTTERDAAMEKLKHGLPARYLEALNERDEARAQLSAANERADFAEAGAAVLCGYLHKHDRDDLLQGNDAGRAILDERADWKRRALDSERAAAYLTTELGDNNERWRIEVSRLREENAALKAERDRYRDETNDLHVHWRNEHGKVVDAHDATKAALGKCIGALRRYVPSDEDCAINLGTREDVAAAREAFSEGAKCVRAAHAAVEALKAGGR